MRKVESGEVESLVEVQASDTKKMKLAFCVLHIALGAQGPCRMGATSHQQCQKLCDTTSYCETWTFHETIHTCWMKTKRAEGVDDPNFVSGLKNQGPFYQVSMKLVGGDYVCELDNNNCQVLTASNQECQKLCDVSEYCFWWNRGKAGKMNQICEFKTLDGWTSAESQNYDAGYKYENTVFPDLWLRRSGQRGDYICDQVNPVHCGDNYC